MNKKYRYLKLVTWFVLTLGILSCTMKPEPINYGHDQCSFCKMNIVVRSHAAQLVTPKGRQMKYDAVECLIWNLNQKPEFKSGLLYVADYYEPGKIIPAKEAFYIISPKVKSPMGANLSAVKSEQAAREFTGEFGGQVFAWEDILKEIE